MRALADKLKERDIPYRTDVSAQTLSTFRIGGVVSIVIEPRCVGELQNAVLFCRDCGMRHVILGNGSNVLFEDGHLALAVIRTTALDFVRVLPDGIVAGCGVLLPQLCRLAAMRGFAGLSFACGIPGTLGGALAMNAGAHGKSISDVVKSVKLLNLTTGDIRTDVNLKKSSNYRKSGIEFEKEIFLSAELALQGGEDPTCLLDEMSRLKAARKASQPLEFPSAGCVFKRPHPDQPIGKLLDELGCKGMRVGGASVSTKHAAFIINEGGASATDVINLMWKIQKKAEKERGMTLEREIRIISG